MSRSHEKFKRTTTGSRSETKPKNAFLNWKKTERFAASHVLLAIFRGNGCVWSAPRDCRPLRARAETDKSIRMIRKSVQRFNESKMHLIFNTVLCRTSAMHQNEQLKIPYDCILGHREPEIAHTANRERDNDADKRNIALCAPLADEPNSATTTQFVRFAKTTPCVCEIKDAK